MRVMVMVGASEESEAGAMPSEAELAEMGEFNEQLHEAGILLAGEGLHPSSRAARIDYSGPEPRVVDGPFAETKELIAGYWVLEVESMEEAVEWMRKAPFRDGRVEIRPIFEADDFGEEFTPELREAEERMRREIEERKG